MTTAGQEPKADLVDGVLVPPDAEVRPQLSVVLPTMNEEEGVAECLERAKGAMRELGVTGEIVISDSSEDRTPEIARELGARVVTPDKPGYGYAYRYAFERVRGDFVAIGDADTTYDFRELPKLMERMLETEADMVMGSRFAGEIKDGAMPPLHQYVGNPLLTRFLNVFYGMDVSDAHSGFRLLTRDALERLPLETEGMEFASEMIMTAGAGEYEIEEVPITYHEREGEATLSSFRDGWRHVKFMLVNAPGYLFGVPGVLVALLGAVVMALAATGTSVGGVTLGTHALLGGSLLTVGGIQVAALAAFAAVGADPIRAPSDPISRHLRSGFELKHGVIVGGAVFALGAGYAAVLIARWAGGGFGPVPLAAGNVVAFTAVVVGMVTLFDSFFLSAVRGVE
jgi:hypothetical protein